MLAGRSQLLCEYENHYVIQFKIIHDTTTTSEMEANLAAAVASPPLSLLSAQGECLDALECEPVSTENQYHQDAACRRR